MIIVTGGAGFIGCNIIKALNKMQHKNILVVDHLKDGKKYENLTGLLIADYMDRNYFINHIATSTYIKNIDVVFHEGACSRTDEWDGQYMMENNYQYSKDLLLCCIQHNIPFIYASSAAVYGNSISGLSQCCNNYCERPINMYSYSKLLFDQYVRSVLPKVTSQICGLRYFNVYGPYESHKGVMASMIFRLYNQIKCKEYPTLFIGSKKIKRDFIYVDDIVNINLWMWDNKVSGIFDCGTGTVASFESIAKIVLDFFSLNIAIKYIPIPEQLRKHYQFFTKANLTPLNNVGYNQSFITLNTGVNQYLRWLACNNI